MLMAVRHQYRAPTARDLEVAESVWTESVGQSSDEHLDALDDCLEQLNGRSREAIDMQYRDGRSRRAIAESLGMTEDGVKTMLRRLRASLRRCVERRLKP